MINIVECALSDVIITICNLFITKKIMDRKINFKKIRTYFIILLMYICTLLNYLYVNKYIRIIVITVFMSIFIKHLFNETMKNSILASLTQQMIYMISEIIFAIIISFLFRFTANEIANTQFGDFTANFIICVISFVVVNIPLTSKFYLSCCKITDKIRNIHLILFTFFIILIANILAMTVYYKVGFSYLLLFNSFLTVFCLTIVLYSFKTKNNYIKVYNKYSTTLNSLKEYEDILDKYRISNHENKNQIMTIRGMLTSKDKKVLNYVNTIINNSLKDSDKTLIEVTKIPSGGLRGLIYSKLLMMEELKIKYILRSSKMVKTVDLINNIDDSTMLDICKVIGVYLDNSIQEVEKLEMKNISIELNVEDNFFVISISNNFKGKIDLEKIEQKGYTSKGKGHGYGLVLTKTIIDKNKLLSNEKMINKDIFTQKLKIKM